MSRYIPSSYIGSSPTYAWNLQIESLPTRSADEQPLQNILSISTAGRNRYLLHFNSHHSLIQWTAGIRLAMFEHSTLQEAYTGALIAGKGKTLNNINLVMERSRFKTEEWVRVRFGAGVPWRRCWCVITPPDEKEYAKLQKELKKRSPYDRSPVPVLKGDIKFYDTRKDGKKQKKAQPIASITDAYSAYAIYPQAKSLIDASTLLKIEGNVAVHTDPPSTNEGFVFIMPETHPAVSGFEMLLRFLFPTWDTFGLYGRPGRLVASVLDARSLMFAMPKSKRYGYLELLDVSSLILEDGSSGWSERDWRKRLKEVTGTRMNAVEDGTQSHSRSSSRKSARLSFGGATGGVPKQPRVGFTEEKAATRSSRSFSLSGPVRTDSAPPDAQRERPPPSMLGVQAQHARNSSDPNVHGSAPPPRMDYGGNGGNQSPQRNLPPLKTAFQDRMASNDYQSSDDERGANTPPLRDLDGMRQMHTPEPVSRPPAFNHAAQARPTSKAYHSPELRRANSRLSSTTLAQLAKAGGLGDVPQDADNENASQRKERENAVGSGPSVLPYANTSVGTSANDNRSREALSPSSPHSPSNGLPPPLNLSKQRSKSPLAQSPYGPPSPYVGGPNPSSRPGTSEGRRSPMPPGQHPRSPHPGQGPHPQFPNQRPDPNRPPPQGGRGGPPPGMRPPQQRGPPGNGPPPPGPYNNNRPGPPGQRQPGPPGPYGPPNRAGPPPHMQSGQRKPLPERMHQNFDQGQRPGNMSAASSVTANEIIDHYSYERPIEPARRGTPQSDRRPGPPMRQDSNHSSNYDDYPITQRSRDPPERVERPRAGVLKTIGGEDPDAPPKSNFDIPDINFGRTINYGVLDPPRSKTPTALVPGRPDHEQRPLPGSKSPAPVRQGSDDAKRTMPWQPGTSSPGTGARGLSAEEYVQQRADGGPAPYHARSASGNTLGSRSGTPSPGFNRRSRSGSIDLLQRPGSRGANATMNMSSSGELSSHLSAREQEHMARMTGSPLVNVPVNQHQGQAQGPGLVGTIDARERERQQVRQGANNQAVQQAMQPRQYQQPQQPMGYPQQMPQQQQAYQHQMMAERSMSPPSNYGPMGRGGGQYGGPPNGPYGGPQSGSSSPQMYGQSASFSRPMRAGPPSPQPPPGPYPPGPQSPPRGGNPPYQGQAF